MNPLSTWTYYCRHKRHAALLLSLSLVITVGIYALVALVWGVFIEPGRLAYMAFSKFSMVTPQATKTGSDPAVLAQLQSNPDIAKIIPSTFIRIRLPGMVPGQGFQFDLLGLMEADAAYILERFDATVKAGRLPRPGAAELVLSENVANMLDLKVGDSYVVTSFEFYVGMDAPPKPNTFGVVGILESNTQLGIVSLEFLNHHEEYHQLPARFLIVAQEGREAAVDGFLRSEILTLETGVMTHTMLSERILNEALPGLGMLLPVVIIVAMSFSLVIVVVNQLANARRLPEFGILHATGRSKSWLINRLTKETTFLALAGWALGIVIACALLYLLKVTVFAVQGYDLNYNAWLPVLFSLPLPAVIAGFTFLAIRRSFTRLDPVAIIERRELSTETSFRAEADQKRPSKASSSSVKPLASATFYRRHRRRAVLLISAMGLMILAVVLFIFTLAVGADAKEPFLSFLKRVSIVRSPGIVQSLDPGVVTQVEEHPMITRLIPVAPRYSMLSVYIPPFNTVEASPFAVYAEDMAFLVELYGLELKEGQLPHPGTNEMVIPEALSDNRYIKVGDVIGDPDHPAYPNAPSLDTEFVISGIFARPVAPGDGSSLGFVSLEFLESQESFDIPDILPLIVVPRPGQKSDLDDWLENELAGENASVLTYRREISRIQNQAKQDLLSIALLEGIITIVAAIGLAVLNYIFISQRQAEFGLLHALGYNRNELVRRVFGETSFTVAAAWGSSAILALAGMHILRIVVFEPRGLAFSLFNLTPWLYTLPIPVLVLAISAGSTARTLSKLDPITIIEGR